MSLRKSGYRGVQTEGISPLRGPAILRADKHLIEERLPASVARFLQFVACSDLISMLPNLPILNPRRTKQEILLHAETRRTSDWDVHAAHRNYGSLVSAQVAASLLSFASTWLTARALGPAGYGGLAAVLAASQCASQLGISWTSPSLVRFGCEEFVGTGRVTSAFWTRLGLMLPNLFLLLIASRWWLPPLCNLLHLPGEAEALVLIHLVASAAWIHVQQALLAAKLPRFAAALLATERVQVLFSLLALAALGKLSWTSATWAYVLSPALACGTGLWRLRPFLGSHRPFEARLLGSMVRFSLPLIPYSAIGYFSTQYLDAIFITRLLSQAELGIYWVAFQVAGVMMQLPLLAGTLLLPYFITAQASSRDGSVERFFNDLLPALTLAWSTVCALVAALGSYLVPLLLGPAFQSLAAPLWPLAAACAVAGPNLMGYAPLSNAKSATYVAAGAAIVSATTNLTLNAVLIPRWGLAGCAWATTFAYSASLIATAHFIRRRLGVRPTWIAVALTPALAGAALSVWQARGLGAIAVSLCVAALVAARHRHAVRKALQLGLGRPAPAAAAL